jgi:hypothetical protein
LIVATTPLTLTANTRPWRHHPGIGHHDIKTPEFIAHGLDGITDIVFAANVPWPCNPTVRQVHSPCGNIEAKTNGSGIRQVAYNCPPDASRGTGYEGDLILQQTFHRRFHCSRVASG